MIKRLSVFARVILLLAPAVLTAAPFQADRVPASARWLLHVDVAALKASTVGQALLEGGISEDVARRLDMAKILFSVDPRHDLDGITAFGEGPEPTDAVLVLTGRFNAQRLTELITLLDAYRVDAHGDRAVHSWIDQASGQPQVGVFVDAGTLMLGRRADRLRRALDAWDDKTDRLSRQRQERLSRQAPRTPGTMIGLTADLRDFALVGNPLVAALRGVGQLTVRVAESVPDGVSLSVDIQRETPEQAADLEQILRGLLIMVVFQVQSEQPALAELLRAVTVRATGPALTLQLSYPADAVASIVRSALDRALRPQ